MRRNRLAAAAAVAIVAIGATAVVGVTMLEDEPDHSVEYELSNKCYPNENFTGYCESELIVSDFGNAEYVELRGITDHNGDTEIRTATESHSIAATTDVYYQNEIVVTAVLESGDRVVLERHRISCEDDVGESSCPADKGDK